MPLLRTAKPKANASCVIEQELSDVVTGVLPKEDSLGRITAKLMDVCVNTLEKTIRDYRDSFVAQATSILQGEIEDAAEPMLLPEGTRFYRRTAGAAVFVIEHKPTVRNLYFYESDNVNPKTVKNRKTWRNNYRLALPYIVFMPVFHYKKGVKKPLFSAMCVAYRNEPLNSFNDLLYHPNLPNLGRPVHLDPSTRDTVDGDVKEFTEMVMCQGFQDLSEYKSFYLEPTNMPEMVNQVLEHFWTSRYTGELAGMWKKMQYRDAQHYGSLELWEKASLEDPLFVLKSPWVPAIRLDCLIGKILQYHDQGSADLSAQAGNYVATIHDATWRKLLVNCKGEQKNLAVAFGKRLEEILKKFAVEMAKGLTVINNETIRRTVQFAVAQALKESVK